uniref:Uncharacterized protein n=1 Tax=Cucumis melo TaxID=3656 RepID=A0A9I9EM09_CUCME
MVKDKDIEDEEDVKAIARLFADMGDSCVELIATSNRFCYVVEVLPESIGATKSYLRQFIDV